MMSRSIAMPGLRNRGSPSPSLNLIVKSLNTGSKFPNALTKVGLTRVS